MIENVDVLDQLREHTSALCRMRSLKQLDPTIKGDIHAVVRDIYSAGLRLHKEKAMDESVAIITQSQILLSYEDEQLKTGESIYTLLSYSLRELNNLPQSRRMLINALGFCDETVPVRNIEKLIAIILEESLALDPSCSQSYVVDIKTCLTDLLSVFKQRQIPSTFQQDVLMYLQYSLEQSCHRILSDLRTISSNRINIESTSKLKGLKALVLVRNAVWALLLEGSESNPRFLLQSALGKRLYIFGSYYCQKEPIVFREECAVVIETLRDIGKGSSLEKSNMIRAEASTWHMVILLEMTLLLNYTGAMGTNPMVFDELCRNVALWKDVIEKQQLDSRFGDQCIQALEAFVACLGALNLPEVKSQFLEIESQVRERIGTNAPFVRLPVYLALPFCMLNSYKPVDSDRIEMSGVRREYKDENVSQLYRIDYLLHESSQMLYGKEITSRFDGKCEILKEIIEALELLKSKQININQNLSFYKAIGMREIMVYITLSNVHFDRGDWQYAAEEAKMALALVWKLARKFCHEATKGEKVMANTRHFIIPDEMLPRSISHSVHADESRMLMQSKNKSLIYFQAQEYELWEILQVTRHILCYLGDIYSLAGNVYKSTTYFSEALSLTGGLHSFGFLHNQVVLEYSKFHLQCGRNIQARRTLEILDKNYQKEIAARYSASIENFVPLRLQYCIEMIQRGDIQNEAADAISFYEKGLKVLDKLPNTSKQCHMRVRIYRGIVTSLYIQYEDSNHNDFSVRQSLTNYLGELKSLLNKCEDKIERCMGICELTRINLLLLYKGNNENIMSLEECILILEEAFDLSSALGVLYTQQCTRKVLGVAYHLKNERLSSESSLEANRFRFACASLMTNIFSHTEKNVNSVHQSKEQDIYSRLQILSLSQQEKKSISFLNEWVQNFRDKIMSDFLPSNWNVISISTGLDRDQLIITRITVCIYFKCFSISSFMC
jgi:tetratricopeptide (TPR) repeat protein